MKVPLLVSALSFRLRNSATLHHKKGVLYITCMRALCGASSQDSLLFFAVLFCFLTICLGIGTIHLRTLVLIVLIVFLPSKEGLYQDRPLLYPFHHFMSLLWSCFSPDSA